MGASEKRRGRHTQLLHTVVHQLLFLLLIGDGLCLQLTGLWMNSAHTVRTGRWARVQAQSWANPVSGMIPFNVSAPATMHIGDTFSSAIPA